MALPDQIIIPLICPSALWKTDTGDVISWMMTVFPLILKRGHYGESILQEENLTLTMICREMLHRVCREQELK